MKKRIGKEHQHTGKYLQSYVKKVSEFMKSRSYKACRFHWICRPRIIGFLHFSVSLLLTFLTKHISYYLRHFLLKLSQKDYGKAVLQINKVSNLHPDASALKRKHNPGEAWSK